MYTRTKGMRPDVNLSGVADVPGRGVCNELGFGQASL